MNSIRNKPLFHLGKFPIGVVELIILIEIIGAIVLASNKPLETTLGITPGGLKSGNLLSILTYSFFNRLDVLLIIGIIFFYRFGRVVEQQLGKTIFLYLCGISILTPPLVMVLFSLCGLHIDHKHPFLGGSVLHFCVFASFCIIYPHFPTIIRNISMKWLGIIFLSIALLSFLSNKHYDLAIGFIISVALAILLIQSQGKATLRIFPSSVSKPSSKKRKPIKQKSNKPAKKKYTSKLKPKVTVKSETTIDAILDKISEHGLHSLTEEERKTLQDAKK